MVTDFVLVIERWKCKQVSLDVSLAIAAAPEQIPAMLAYYSMYRTS